MLLGDISERCLSVFQKLKLSLRNCQPYSSGMLNIGKFKTCTRKIKDFGGQWMRQTRWPRRKLTKSELQYGEENVLNCKGKVKDSGGQWMRWTRQTLGKLAESLSMERKICGFAEENHGFRWPVDAADQADSE